MCTCCTCCTKKIYHFYKLVCYITRSAKVKWVTWRGFVRAVNLLYQLILVKWFVVFWMCDVVALIQYCKLFVCKIRDYCNAGLVQSVEAFTFLILDTTFWHTVSDVVLESGSVLEYLFWGLGLGLGLEPQDSVGLEVFRNWTQAQHCMTWN